MSKITLLCLFGGKSSEYEVSLISAYSILQNADRDKYDIVTVGITKQGDWYYYTGDIASVKDGTWCSDTNNLKKAALSPSPSDSALLVFDEGVLEKLSIFFIFFNTCSTASG